MTKTIDLTKAFDMVNHTKLISTLTLSSLSNNTKPWLSAYLKRRGLTGIGKKMGLRGIGRKRRGFRGIGRKRRGFQEDRVEEAGK